MSCCSAERAGAAGPARAGGLMVGFGAAWHALSAAARQSNAHRWSVVKVPCRVATVRAAVKRDRLSIWDTPKPLCRWVSSSARTPRVIEMDSADGGARSLAVRQRRWAYDDGHAT